MGAKPSHPWSIADSIPIEAELPGMRVGYPFAPVGDAGSYVSAAVMDSNDDIDRSHRVAIQRVIPDQHGPALFEISTSRNESSPFTLSAFVKSSNPTSQESTRVCGQILGREVVPIAFSLAKHPSVLPLQSCIESPENVFWLISEQAAYTLDDVLRFSPAFLDAEGARTLIIFSVLSALSYAHSKGAIHGALRTSHVLFPLNGQLWVQVSGWRLPRRPRAMSVKDRVECAYEQWACGNMSNLDYVMTLNGLAGRRLGDPNHHPIVPWVIDFSEKPPLGGWRDLSRSKYRLTKGDMQLDLTYDGGRSPQAHHVTDLLTELSYYIYLARCTPLPILRRHVRSNFRAAEYPVSVSSLYASMPDECIPELFTDPAIFKTMHDVMPSLVIPSWADSPEDFIRLHRAALESDHVSQHLHLWIDITFGYRLSGLAGLEAKNIALIHHSSPRSHGFVQLFKVPHPARRCCVGIDEVPDRDPDPPSSDLPSQAVSSPVGMTAADVFATIRAAVGEMTFMIETETVSAPPKPPPSKAAHPGSQEYADASTASRLFHSMNSTEQHESFVKVFQRLSVPSVQFLEDDDSIDDPTRTFEALQREDSFAVGQLIWDLYMNPEPLFSHESIVNDEQVLASRIKANLPCGISELVLSLLSRGLQPTPADVLRDCTVRYPGLFPSYIPSVYAMLSEIHSNQCPLAMRFDGMPSEALRLVVPHILPLLHSASERRNVIDVLQHIMPRIGQSACRQLVLPHYLPILQLQPDEDDLLTDVMNPVHMGILMQCFGVSTFLVEILPHVLSTRTNSHSVVMWLLHELSPVLVMRHIVGPLLLRLGRSRSTSSNTIIADASVLLGASVVSEHIVPMILPIIERVVQSIDLQDNDDVLCGLLSLLAALIPQLSERRALLLLVEDWTVLFQLLHMPLSNEELAVQLATTLVVLCSHVGSSSTRLEILPHLTPFFLLYAKSVQMMDVDNPPAIFPHAAVALLYTCAIRLLGRAVLSDEVGDHASVLESRTAQHLIEPVSMLLSPSKSSPESPVDAEHGDGEEWVTIREGEGKDVDQRWLGMMPRSALASRPSEVGWDVQGKLLMAYRTSTSARVKGIASDPTESLIASASRDGFAKLWRVGHPNCVLTYKGHQGASLNGVQFVGKEQVCTVGQDVHLWNTETGQNLLHYSPGLPVVQSVSVNSLLFVGCSDGTVRSVDMRSGRQQFTWRLSPSSVVHQLRCMVECNGLVAGGFSSGQVAALDYRTGSIVYSWRAHESAVVGLAGSDELLVSASQDRGMTMWRLDEERHSIAHFRDVVDTPVSLAIHGKRVIAVGGTSISYAQHDQVSLQRCHLSVGALRGAISSAVVMGQSQLIVSGFEDGSLLMVH